MTHFIYRIKNKMRKDIFLRKIEILDWIDQNKSKAFICRELKCKAETLNFWLLRFNITYKGNQSLKGQKISTTKKSAMHYIENDIIIAAHKLKNKLIEEKIKEYKCEKCKLSKWNNIDIPLELHHIDKNRYNNKLENLQILCSNCHAQEHSNENRNITDNNLSYLDEDIKKLNSINYTKILFDKYVPKKIKNELKSIRIIKKYYCECGKEIKKTSKQCEECYRINERKVKDRPSREELILMVKESSLEAVGRKYNVTGNAVKKWLKNGPVVQLE